LVSIRFCGKASRCWLIKTRRAFVKNQRGYALGHKPYAGFRS